MKVLFFITFLTLSLCASSFKRNRLHHFPSPKINPLEASKPAHTSSLVKEINSKKAGWSAALYPRFEGKTQFELSQKLLGFVDPGVKITQELRAQYTPPPPSATLLPENFYAFDKWSTCKSMKMIRDQGNCGSCWAFASAEVISDRICINKYTQDIVSPFHIASCAISNGCGGGWMSQAFDYYISRGVVLDSCQPYSLPLRCKKMCTNWGYRGTYTQALKKGISKYILPFNEEEIKKEIYNRGPITAAFNVYYDFFSYKSGIYQYTGETALAGGHAIKILGWGVENGVNFWYCANSWGTGWGMNGFFKIKRGTDECKIESWHVVTGLPE